MTYYLLPRTSISLYKCIEYIEQEALPESVLSNSLAFYLYEIKERLDSQAKEWDIFKKYTNPYEYINTVVPTYKKCVAKYKCLSRSYFKMIEMIHTFNLLFASSSIQSFHLAEGPGGFIEALADIRRSPTDKYTGMTILDDKNDNNIPAWKKTDIFLRQHPNVCIETGEDKTGDILSLANFRYCAEKYKSSMELITADGGFDFSVDFNKQENSIAKLLFAQTCFALTMQKKNGAFILKIFDCFMQHTVDILYLLSSFYEKVYVFKPNTSRYANSEKYIICKGFLFKDATDFYPFLEAAFAKMAASNSEYVANFLNIIPNSYFTNKLEEYNAFFGEKQIENIQNTITIIEDKNRQYKIDALIQANIQKCVQWCNKYNIETNVF